MRPPAYWLSGDPVQVRRGRQWRGGGRVVLVHDTGTAVVGWDSPSEESIESLADLRPDVGDLAELARAVGFVAWVSTELEPKDVDTLARAALALRCLARRR